jgi:hypothetical protein
MEIVVAVTILFHLNWLLPNPTLQLTNSYFSLRGKYRQADARRFGILFLS